MATKEAIKKIQDKATEDYKSRTEDLYNKNAMLEEKIVNMTMSLNMISKKVDSFNPDKVKDSIDEIKAKLAEIDVLLNSHKALIKILRDRIGV